MGAATELNQALSDRIEFGWQAAVQPLTVPLEMPGMDIVISKSGQAWGRVSFLSDDTPVYIAAGPRSAERFFESIQLEIFTLPGDRFLPARIADAWASLWRHDQSTGESPVPGFTFQPTRVIPVVRSTEEGGRLKTDCLTAFERDFQP